MRGGRVSLEGGERLRLLREGERLEERERESARLEERERETVKLGDNVTWTRGREKDSESWSQ